MLRATALSIVVLSSLVLPAAAPAEPSEAPARIFVARRIVTLDPARPTAEAVAVAGGRILATGDLVTLRRRFASRGVVVDRRFAHDVLVPGFVDGHLHPTMAALLLPMEFVTPWDWDLPGRRVKGVRSAAGYRARLRQLHAAKRDPAEWLFAWGYHPLFHGPLTRSDLDAISATRPIVAWHRSFHEIVVNTPARDALGLDPERARAHPQIDWEAGHFFERGLVPAVEKLSPRLLSPERFLAGLAMTRAAIHRGGITTVADMAAGLLDLEREWSAWRAVLEGSDVPFRTLLVPDGRGLGARLGHERAKALVADLPARNTHRLRFVRQIKLFADGAFYSQLMQLGPPGYLDGHQGEWLMEPEALEAAARLYWKDGYQIHVHANGDLGVAAALDVLETLQRELPRADHRFTLHHVGYSTEAQAVRAARLGAFVSANPYYLHALADVYARVGLGPERAAHIARLGSFERAGVPLSLHSDFTMAPADPLRLAWVAAWRQTASGWIAAPGERLSPDAALRGITLEAARSIGLEDEIGSLEPGKRADFTVLSADPWSLPVTRWPEIRVRGTVFEGRSFPIED